MVRTAAYPARDHFEIEIFAQESKVNGTQRVKPGRQKKKLGLFQGRENP
jgi:hypothetical protein